MTAIKNIFCVSAFLLSLAINAVAGINEGVAAYNAKNYALAKKELAPLAEKPGDAHAQFLLGTLYFYGKGVPTNVPYALELYRKSAAQNYSDAQLRLGVMYLYGIGLPKDHLLAVALFRKAADQGNAAAQVNLGYMYAMGIGVQKNRTVANEWYKKAADQGNSTAQSNLGDSYIQGDGVAQSYHTAADWYRKSASQGNALGQRNLGALYANGQGVPRNIVVAYALFKTAAERAGSRDKSQIDQGYETDPREFQHLISMAESEMDQAQIHDAQGLVRELKTPGNSLKAIDRYLGVAHPEPITENLVAFPTNGEVYVYTLMKPDKSPSYTYFIELAHKTGGWSLRVKNPGSGWIDQTCSGRCLLNEVPKSVVRDRFPSNAYDIDCLARLADSTFFCVASNKSNPSVITTYLESRTSSGETPRSFLLRVDPTRIAR